MRVADRTTQRNYLEYLDRAKTNYATTNERIASGARFLSLSDDVSAGTRVLRVREDMAKTQNYYETIKSVNDELSVTENAITSISSILSNVHTKIVKGLNDATGTSGREALANEIDNLKSEILQYANTKYNNKYVLGGTSAVSAPFTVKDGNLYYNGIDIRNITKDETTKRYQYTDTTDGKTKDVPMDDDLYADIGLGLTFKKGSDGKVTTDVVSDTAMKVSYSGLEVLGFGKGGTTGSYSNIYNLLTDISKSLRASDMTKLGELDAELTNTSQSFSKFVTDVGTKTSYLDDLQESTEAKLDSYQSQVSNLMGIDDAEEATNQTLNDYVLKAVLSMGSKILPLSLMDYIR